MSAPSPSGAEGQDSRSTALMLAAEGFKIVPLPPREKFPRGLAEWQKRATDDVAQIKRWFDKNPERGVGWCMGTQPNGMNLAGIDVDVADGKLGFSTMASLRDRFGLREMMRNTIRTETGTGGWHMIIDTGPVVVTNGKLGPGVDLRGEGGFLVSPPSIHPNGQAYRWVDGKAPWDLPPFRVWETFANWLNHPEAEDDGVAPARPRPLEVVGSVSDATPADWARANLRIPDLLVEGGWQYRETKGMDTYWTRPDKSIRDGHSAVLHDDAPLVVWSTSAPAPFWRAGRDAKDGSRVLSPLEVFAAVRCNGDLQSASREIRKLMPKDGPPPVTVKVTGADPPDVPSSPPARDLNLPAEFWNARPVLTHIRDAAYSRMVSPDAVLMSTFTRYSALVPPSYRIPAYVVGDATFDFIGCAVASSSGGKTGSNITARDLLPVDRKDVHMDRPLGSGEGLVQGFLVPEVDPETNKPTGRQVVGVTAIHFTIDEGTVLIEQQARKGTTIVGTLCSAWAGATLGQLNASAETRRVIEGGRVRVAVMMNIQTANGWRLLDDASMVTGLPSRIVWATAHDPKAPGIDDLPTWPGRLDVWVPPSITGQLTYVTYADEIVREVRSRRHAVVNESLVEAPMDGHLGLCRMKIAGMLALMDGRPAVNADDWALAGMLIDSSVSVRGELVRAKAIADRERINTMGEAQAFREGVVESVKERQAVAALSDKIVARTPPEGIGTNALRKLICSSKTKERFPAALEQAVRRGAVQVDEGVIKPT